MVNFATIKLVIPTAVKWMIVSDFAAAALIGLAHIPSVVWGISTVGFVTVASLVISGWEQYAQKQEAASAGNPNAPVVNPANPIPGSSPSTTTTTTTTTVPNTVTVPGTTTVIIPAITYSVNGNVVTVTPNSPLGTSETVGNQVFTVGQQTTAAFTTPNGTAVPIGSFYIGDGEFEWNGDFYD